jgi:hypothetical protein
MGERLSSGLCPRTPVVKFSSPDKGRLSRSACSPDEIPIRFPFLPPPVMSMLKTVAGRMGLCYG